MPDNLQPAIDQWRSQAELYKNSNPALSRSCERTAQALEIERDTGVAVCSCHHKPFPKEVDRGCSNRHTAVSVNKPGD